MITISVLMNA